MCAIVVFDAFLLSLDVFLLDELSEIGFVEISQCLCLVAIFLAYFHFSKFDKENSALFVLMGGFFACLFVRELDLFLDTVFYHGAWKVAALAVAFTCIFFALKKQSLSNLANSLLNFTKTPQFGLMLGGLLCVLIFSRFFGMRIIWDAVSLSERANFVKEVAEETCELFGYTLIFLATAWLGFERKFFKFKD